MILLSILKKEKITKTEFSKWMGVHITTVTNWCADDSYPTTGPKGRQILGFIKNPSLILTERKESHISLEDKVISMVVEQLRDDKDFVAYVLKYNKK